MNCECFKTRLADFALGAEDPEFGAHLNGCANCRAARDAQRALLASIDRGLASMTAGEPSGDFAAHVRQRIAQEGVTTRPWFAGRLPVTATALAFVVLVGVLAIGPPPRPPQTAVVTPPAPADKSSDAAPLEAARTEPPRSVAIRRPPRAPKPAENREPEVLVPRGEMAAVMRLYDANWNGKVDGASLVAETRSVTDSLKPLAVAELKIPALEVEPLEGGEKPKGSSENR